MKSHRNNDQRQSHSEPSNLLRSVGLKASKQRLAILEALKTTPCPAAADDLFRALPAKTCDRATLYRNLAHLENVGLIRKVQLGDGTARFEMTDVHHHHHHIVCRNCRRIEHLDICGIARIEASIAKRGYRSINHSLEFSGLCSRC